MKKAPSYSIFVRFRGSRLPLRRGIRDEETALALARELRANRFHDANSVFVVKEPEGRIVTEPAAASTNGIPAPREAPAAVAAARVRITSKRVDVLARALGAAQVVAARDRLAHLLRAMDRARTARRRADAAIEAVDRKLATMADCLPENIKTLQQQTRAVHAQTGAVAENLEQVVQRIAHRLDRSEALRAGGSFPYAARRV